jgi:peptidoglycan/xylan/chitin deacetylase (PgdA/CDA1 family)
VSAGSKQTGAAMLAAVLAATSLTACASANASAPKPCSGGYVALTFDDGPDPAVTPHLLDVLHTAGIRATFFTVGANVEKNPGTARREAADGHSVQGHSWSHPDLAKLPVAAAVAQLTKGAQAVADTGLPRPTFYRPPFNSTTRPLRDAAATAGLTEVGYTVETSDWKDPGVDQIVARAQAVRAGGIVQMHDRGHPQTVDAINRFAEAIRARHMCFGGLERTSQANPDAPTWQQFYARAVAW